MFFLKPMASIIVLIAALSLTATSHAQATDTDSLDPAYTSITSNQKDALLAELLQGRDSAGFVDTSVKVEYRKDGQLVLKRDLEVKRRRKIEETAEFCISGPRSGLEKRRHDNCHHRTRTTGYTNDG